VQLLDIGLVDVLLGQRELDLGEREDTELLAPRQKVLDLFEFLEFCD
jgi:hypothetical protein